MSDTIEPPADKPPAPDYQSSYDRISPYNPASYVCTGYGNEPYEYFDGTPGTDRDHRFTIDLEEGSMDHLRDVRPYLYCVGYWSRPSTSHQPDVERLPCHDVERAYVEWGRQYLIEERTKQHGYFLARRDWHHLNVPMAQGFPFFLLKLNPPEEGDYGFDEMHEYGDDDHDFLRAVLKTNVRTPLPPRNEILTALDKPNWDKFIQWIYGPEIHGAMHMVNSNYWPSDVMSERVSNGSGWRGWMNRDSWEGRWSRY